MGRTQNRIMARMSALVLGAFACLLSAALIPMLASLNQTLDRLQPGTVLAAYKDPYAIHQPIRLSSAPDLVLASGVLIADPGPDARGLRRLVLDQPHFVLDASTRLTVRGMAGADTLSIEGAELPDIVGPLLRQLHGLKIDQVVIRRGTLAIDSDGAGHETISGIEAEIGGFAKGTLTAVGRMTYRGLAFTVDATTAAQPTRDAARPTTALRPTRLSVKSALVSASFDGTVDASGPLELRGSGEATVPRLGEMGRWLSGAVLPEHVFRDVIVKGQMQWSQGVLAIDKASVAFDNQEPATGTLSLSRSGATPTLEATLAFNTFEAAPYLAAATPAETATGLPPDGWRALALDVPYAHGLKTDLRVSATKVLLGGAALGRAAVSVSIMDGKLLADLAEFEFPGGKGAAQLSIDSVAGPARVAVRGRADVADLGTILDEVAGIGLLSGKGTIQVDLTGSGSSIGQFMTLAGGRVAITSGAGAQILADLKVVRSAITEARTPQWSSMPRTAAPADALDVKAVIQNGRVQIDSATLRSGTTVFSATGQLYPHSKEIDLRVSLRDGRPGDRGRGPQGEPPPSVVFRGPWNTPQVLPAEPAPAHP